MRVLLVDDESRVLEGLGRIVPQLWSHDDDIDVVTAESGVAALTLLEQESIDLVVTDMRMPGMDGAELLRRVHERWPATMRVVLSGYMEDAASVRSARYAHQFLTKPCPPAAIEEVLDRAFSLTRILSCVHTRRVVASLGCLPAPPRTYQELRTLLSAGDPDLRAVARVVERDPALTAKVLQLVNSAFFSRRFPVSSVADAIARIGLKMLQALAACTALYQAVGTGVDAAFLEAAQRHAATLAGIARQLAGPAAFLPAMLCDVGLLVLHGAETADEADGEPLHPRIGGCLLTLWGFQEEVVGAVLGHHRAPAESADAVAVAVSYAARWLDGVVSDEELLTRYPRLPTREADSEA